MFELNPSQKLKHRVKNNVDPCELEDWTIISMDGDGLLYLVNELRWQR
jgi:hypothetical protein